jgi:PRTRC genetic system protein C
MESHVLTRYFEFNGQRLPDPNPKLPVEEVRALNAHQYPDIATASAGWRRHLVFDVCEVRDSEP